MGKKVFEIAGVRHLPPPPPLVKGVGTKKLGKGRIKCLTQKLDKQPAWTSDEKSFILPNLLQHVFLTNSALPVYLYPIQAGVFWNHRGWRGHIVPTSVFFYLWSNYNQTWHDGTLGQNLSKAIKILLPSSLGCKYDVIKLFLVSFLVKIRVSLSFVQFS